jgi:hypothetical protein
LKVGAINPNCPTHQSEDLCLPVRSLGEGWCRPKIPGTGQSPSLRDEKCDAHRAPLQSGERTACPERKSNGRPCVPIFGASPKCFFLISAKLRDGEGAIASTRGACAPRIEESTARNIVFQAVPVQARCLCYIIVRILRTRRVDLANVRALRRRNAVSR